jgi:hypothetical protein
MKYQVTYTEERKIVVEFEINDEGLNQEFLTLGNIKTDSDFKGESDPRWKVENIAYEATYGCGESLSIDYGDWESITNRSIEAVLN